MQDQLNASYPVLPLRDIVVFPHMIVPLFVGREKSVRALEEVMQDDKQILLSSQVDPAEDDPAEDDIYRVGVLANVLQLLKLPDGTVKVLVEGVSRVRITEYLDNEEYFAARAEYMSETPGDATTIEALLRTVSDEFARYAKVKKNIPDEALTAVSDSDDAAKLADLVAGHLGIEVDRKQDLLETLSVSERLEKVYGLMQGEMSVMQVEKKIKTRVKSQMERTQREYYLNEQMKAIQKELGDGEDGEGEVAELESRIEETKLSKEARDKAEAELKKLKNMSPMSAEATVVRNYLDWMLSIPWNNKSRVKKDLRKAQKVLDADHYGLEKVKERIVEYLAVQQRSKKLKGPIMCLVGPPGVGKTSLGQIRGAGHGARVHPHQPGRRARRIRDPRPPADLYRLDARQDHPVAEEGQDDEPADPARRDRQDGAGFPGRSGVGHAGGSRPRTERHLRRSLSRGGIRPQQRDVHHHGQQL